MRISAIRENDFIFALSELQAFDTAGKNTAAGTAVTSIDSIEAPVRWTRRNLTDGIYPAATGGEDILAALRKQRDAVIAKAQDEPTTSARAASATGGALKG